MSYQLLKEDILFYQRFLKVAGFFPGIPDGSWESKTGQADHDFLAASESIATEMGSFDRRSESNIVTLLPKAQRQARTFLQLCSGNAVKVRIISGTRTYAEQDALYAQGRTKPGKIVTNAKGGQSNHNFGIAWDIGLFTADGSYSLDDHLYIQLAKTILPQINTLEWGGNWHRLKDYPHYQLKAVSDDVAKIENLFDGGEVYV